MTKKFFRKILCWVLILPLFAPQVVYAAKSSPAVPVRNQDHFEPEQNAGDKSLTLGRGGFTNNNPTTYTYDLFDRLDITQYADLSSSNFDYDKNSNLTRHTTPSGKPIEYDYDALNRLTTKTYPLTPALNTTYAYDLGTRMTAANNAAGNIDFAYDALNRVLTTTQHLPPNTYNLSYQYDPAGNRTQLVYPSGKTLGYVYDANDRLTGITHNTLNFLQYQYDPLDRRTTKSYLSASLPLASYVYDLGNQLTSVTNTLVGGIPVSQYAYPLYDSVGNRKQLDRTLGTDPVETINYAYNNIYELINVTGAQTHAFDYDNVGNREIADGVTYTPNSLNQYTQVGATTYLYDGNGNLTSDGSNTYTYDEENRLLSIVNGLSSAGYTYDAFNRRVSKTVNGITTYFVYDGDGIIADYDGTGTLSAEYINGDNIDEVLTMERGENTYYYHYDGLGSVTELTDSAGNVVESYTYDPYGNITSALSSVGNPYHFTGRRLDEESGLMDYRNRNYNLFLGRFMQRDQLGYFDSYNLYQYTNNNAINGTDPYGLFTIWDVADVAFFVDSAKSFSECKNLSTGFNLALDTISLLPVIPSLGYLTRIDKVSDVFKKSRKLPFNDADRVKEINHTLDRIESGKPKYKKDGTVFRNDGRGGTKKLPGGNYKEWTVDTPGQKERGKRRIAVDENTGAQYYTDDHYNSWIQIK